jgi:hypothetical protein
MSLRKHWQPSTRNSVISPVGVILPIWLWKVPPVSGSALGVKKSTPSVNQRFPSEPGVTYLGSLFAVGTFYCVNLKRPAASADESIAPSAMASPATTANSTATRRRADGRRYVSILHPSVAGHHPSAPVSVGTSRAYLRTHGSGWMACPVKQLSQG